MDTAGASRFAQNCATQSYSPKIAILGLDATPDLPNYPIFNGAIVPGATFPLNAPGIPAIAEAREGLKTYGNVGFGGMASLGWASGQVLLKAAKYLDPANPQPSQLLQGLWAIKNDTFGGLTVPLTFNKNAPVTASQCVFIWGVTNGSFGAPLGAKPVC
jgi:hypothetical protein